MNALNPPLKAPSSIYGYLQFCKGDKSGLLAVNQFRWSIMSVPNTVYYGHNLLQLKNHADSASQAKSRLLITIKTNSQVMVEAQNQAPSVAVVSNRGAKRNELDESHAASDSLLSSDIESAASVKACSDECSSMASLDLGAMLNEPKTETKEDKLTFCGPQYLLAASSTDKHGMVVLSDVNKSSGQVQYTLQKPLTEMKVGGSLSPGTTDPMLRNETGHFGNEFENGDSQISDQSGSEDSIDVPLNVSVDDDQDGLAVKKSRRGSTDAINEVSPTSQIGSEKFYGMSEQFPTGAISMPASFDIENNFAHYQVSSSSIGFHNTLINQEMKAQGTGTPHFDEAKQDLKRDKVNKSRSKQDGGARRRDFAKIKHSNTLLFDDSTRTPYDMTHLVKPRHRSTIEMISSQEGSDGRVSGEVLAQKRRNRKMQMHSSKSLVKSTFARVRLNEAQDVDDSLDTDAFEAQEELQRWQKHVTKAKTLTDCNSLTLDKQNSSQSVFGAAAVNSKSSYKSVIQAGYNFGGKESTKSIGAAKSDPKAKHDAGGLTTPGQMSEMRLSTPNSSTLNIFQQSRTDATNSASASDIKLMKQPYSDLTMGALPYVPQRVNEKSQEEESARQLRLFQQSLVSMRRQTKPETVRRPSLFEKLFAAQQSQAKAKRGSISSAMEITPSLNKFYSVPSQYSLEPPIAIQKQKFMELLNLEKCGPLPSQSEESYSASLYSNSVIEESKDTISQLDDGGKLAACNDKFIQRQGMSRQQSQSSNALIGFASSEWRRGQTSIIEDYSPIFRRCDNADSLSQINGFSSALAYDRLPLRRSASMEKRAMIDLGRSPQTPFVQNLRSSLKRNSSQRLYQRRNFSPPERLDISGVAVQAVDAAFDAGSGHESARRYSLNKSSIMYPTQRLSQIMMKDHSSSLGKHSFSKSSAREREAAFVTPRMLGAEEESIQTSPENVIKRYEDFPDRSLKLSVYKELTMQIIQALDIVQQIKEFPEVEPSELIDFAFKKPGFDKLLIFDLDETLIHSKRDEDELEYDELEGHYKDAEPDFYVTMESPSSDYGQFEQGVFLRPFTLECLNAVNSDYEVAVFTAGYDWYANPIIDKIDPKGVLIQHRFFRQHAKTVSFKGQESLYKDLSVLKGLDLRRTLIVDNQVFSFARDLSNGIPIAGFYGSKKDSELIKVMKYVHQVAAESDLMVANERQFQLRTMLDSPIEKFVAYYQLDEMSESDENDFEEDGLTIGSSPLVPQSSYQNGKRRKVFNWVGRDGSLEEEEEEEDDGLVSLGIGNDGDSEGEIKLNESLEDGSGSESNQLLRIQSNRQHQLSFGDMLRCDQDPNLRSSTEHNAVPHTRDQRTVNTPQSSQLLRLHAIPAVSLSPPVAAMRRGQSNQDNNIMQANQASPTRQLQDARSMVDDDPYTRISMNDEGNIGGTLSNCPPILQRGSSNEPFDSSDDGQERQGQQDTLFGHLETRNGAADSSQELQPQDTLLVVNSETAADSPLQRGAPRDTSQQREETSAVMELGAVLSEESERDTALRLPPQVRVDNVSQRSSPPSTGELLGHTELSQNKQQQNTASFKSRNKPPRLKIKRKHFQLQHQKSLPPSNYYKVCQTTEKARRRLSSLGQLKGSCVSVHTRLPMAGCGALEGADSSVCCDENSAFQSPFSMPKQLGCARRHAGRGKGGVLGAPQSSLILHHLAANNSGGNSLLLDCTSQQKQEALFNNQNSSSHPSSVRNIQAQEEFKKEANQTFSTAVQQSTSVVQAACAPGNATLSVQQQSKPLATSDSFKKLITFSDPLDEATPSVQQRLPQTAQQASERDSNVQLDTHFTFADIVEREQKTLTSIKKSEKQGRRTVNGPSISSPSLERQQPQQQRRFNGGSFVSLGAATNTQNKRAPQRDCAVGTPSQSFVEKVNSNVNNMLKPPNWNARKMSLMERLNVNAPPSCASNIDYHLDQLKKMYRESGQKVKEGAESSLMEQLLEANPQNATFLTPQSSSNIKPAVLSEHKPTNWQQCSQCAMSNSCKLSQSSHSCDKYRSLKQSINMQGSASSSGKPAAMAAARASANKLQSMFAKQSSVKLTQPVALTAAINVRNSNPTMAHTVSDYLSSGGNLSLNGGQVAKPVREGQDQQKPKIMPPGVRAVGGGLLPPQPAPPSAKTKKQDKQDLAILKMLMAEPNLKYQLSDVSPELAHKKAKAALDARANEQAMQAQLQNMLKTAQAGNDTDSD